VSTKDSQEASHGISEFSIDGVVVIRAINRYCKRMCRVLPHYTSGRTICTISFYVSDNVHAFMYIHMHLIIIHISIFFARTLRTHLLSLLQAS
jgi:hypothetical protein